MSNDKKERPRGESEKFLEYEDEDEGSPESDEPYDDILEMTPTGLKSTRNLPPYVEYEAGYSHQNLPRIFRVSERITKRFRGVRSCSRRSRADGSARNALAEFKERSKRYHPELEVVRCGWHEGTHYWNNVGGGPGSGRQCNGYILTDFYVDFKRPASLSKILETDEEK